MKKYSENIAQGLVVAMLLGVGFIGGWSAAEVKIPVEITQTALETTPGPMGSGVLGDWTTLSHGVYCFTNGVLTNHVIAPAKTTTEKQRAKVLSGNMASDFCPGEDVRLYGDSITFGGKSAFASELNTKTVLVDAWSGRPTIPVADAVEAETSFPESVVIASGTNDIFSPAVMATQINRIKAHIASVSPTTKVFFVDVQITRWSQTDVIERNDQRNGQAVNYAIWNNVDRNRIIQWSARFLANPNLMSTYLSDGVHPKVGTGYAYWAAILRGWLQTLGGI